MENTIQYKTFDFKIDSTKDDADHGVIEGYASTFGNVDQGGDRVLKGAFKKTISENVKWPILADHSPYAPIGMNLESVEDSKGLYVKGELELGVEKARERYLLAKQAARHGGRSGLSIGYQVIKAEPDKNSPRILELKEIKMYEYSLVTFPMNTEALITGAKSFGCIDKVQFLMKHIFNEDISLKDLEIALKQRAKTVDYDPTLIGQSIDKLIEKFKS
jgi:HK97 family phage prohead protease